ncbi:MAG: hypothetical protein K9G62_05650 [Alphaproteobacteria bacterium]|nr:hypothetical protein [Alphaproteobacteria bacterium]
MNLFNFFNGKSKEEDFTEKMENRLHDINEVLTESDCQTRFFANSRVDPTGERVYSIYTGEQKDIDAINAEQEPNCINSKMEAEIRFSPKEIIVGYVKHMYGPHSCGPTMREKKPEVVVDYINNKLVTQALFEAGEEVKYEKHLSLREAGKKNLLRKIL